VVLDKITNIGEGRKRKKLDSVAQLVATFEDEIKDLSDEELAAKTPEFRERYRNGESLDDLLPEAFAVVRGPPGARSASATSTSR
jgi:preprotein translocase subunit SecA